MISDFVYSQPVKIYFGAGQFKKLGDVLAELGLRRGVIVCGRHFAPRAQELASSLDGVCAVFGAVAQNPQLSGVDETVRLAREYDADVIIGIGGGSSIDTAKFAAAITLDGGEAEEYYSGARPFPEKRLPVVAVPTTAGTGSEVTNISIINRTRLGVKMGLTSENMFADYAVLVPELLAKLPLKVFGASSIDALVHAVESSLSPKATVYTKLMGYKAIEMIITGYQKLVSEGMDKLPQYMGDFLTASNMAGFAFGTAGCAAVHALSYPLGGTYHVPHGESNYALFTGVLYKYMEKKQDGEIAHLNAYLAELLHCDVKNVYNELENLLNHILPKKPLHEYGVTEADIPVFTENVLATQGRLTANNFVPLSRDDILDIYKKLY